MVASFIETPFTTKAGYEQWVQAGAPQGALEALALRGGETTPRHSAEMMVDSLGMVAAVPMAHDFAGKLRDFTASMPPLGKHCPSCARLRRRRPPRRRR